MQCSYRQCEANDPQVVHRYKVLYDDRNNGRSVTRILCERHATSVLGFGHVLEVERA